MQGTGSDGRQIQVGQDRCSSGGKQLQVREERCTRDGCDWRLIQVRQKRCTKDELWLKADTGETGKVYKVRVVTEGWYRWDRKGVQGTSCDGKQLQWDSRRVDPEVGHSHHVHVHILGDHPSPVTTLTIVVTVHSVVRAVCWNRSHTPCTSPGLLAETTVILLGIYVTGSVGWNGKAIYSVRHWVCWLNRKSHIIVYVTGVCWRKRKSHI